MSIEMIHMSVGGPTYAIRAIAKIHYFEDHPHLGPLFTNKAGDGISEPKATDPVWVHVNAWYRQGKRFQEVNGIRWCKYKTEMQESRELGLKARSAPHTPEIKP